MEECSDHQKVLHAVSKASKLEGRYTMRFDHPYPDRILERLVWVSTFDKADFEAFVRIFNTCTVVNKEGDNQGTRWLWRNGQNNQNFKQSLTEEFRPFFEPPGEQRFILTRGDPSHEYKSVLCIETSRKAQVLMKLSQDPSKTEDLYQMLEDDPLARSRVDAQGAPISHWAAASGNVSLLEYLSPGCLAEKDGFGNTLMHCAAKHNQHDLFERLPDALAKEYNYWGKSPFDLAGWCLPIQRYLLGKDLAVTGDEAKIWMDLMFSWKLYPSTTIQEELTSVMVLAAQKLGGNDLPHDEHPLRLLLAMVCRDKEYKRMMWLRLCRAGLTANAMDELGTTIFTLACAEMPELVFHAGDPAVTWSRNLDGDSLVDMAARREVHEVNQYLSSTTGMELATRRLEMAMNNRASTGLKYHDHAIAATRAWTEQGKDCLETAMAHLSTAREVIERDPIQDRELQDCVYAAISWRRGRICQLGGKPAKAVMAYGIALRKESRQPEICKLRFHTDTALLEWTQARLTLSLPQELVDCVGLHILATYQQEARDRGWYPLTRRCGDTRSPGHIICSIAAGNL